MLMIMMIIIIMKDNNPNGPYSLDTIVKILQDI